jgi:saccharopine dehydrogenase-like NADP-dependent oxidoreductase
MHQVSVFGAGKIGEAICAMLGGSGRYEVTVADASLERAASIAASFPRVRAEQLDLSDLDRARTLLQGRKAVLCALPFHCNATVARLAKECGAHYFDLTEDVEVGREVERIADGASSVFVPHCGLAPGFISIAAFHLIRSFEAVHSVKMRVGALPLYPSNRLLYNLTWSTEGLINEYIKPCEALLDGKIVHTLPLEGYERFSLDGAEYEAFNTSGGLGTLCRTLEGKVQQLDYKSVRYPGHHDFVQFLMRDLRFRDFPDELRVILERAISTTAQDKCIIFVEVIGVSGGRLRQRTYASTVYNASMHGHHFGAIQITTAAGICAPLDMLLEGKLAARPGVMRAEETPLPEFLVNEFGKYYADERALRAIAT